MIETSFDFKFDDYDDYLFFIANNLRYFNSLKVDDCVFVDCFEVLETWTDSVFDHFERLGGNLTNILKGILTKDSTYLLRSDEFPEKIRVLITAEFIDEVVEIEPYNYNFFLDEFYEQISEKSWIKILKNDLTAYNEIKNPSEALKNLYKTLTL